MTREGSATLHHPPRGVQVLAADYSSHSSLVNAFTGQDAVISTIGAVALSDQTKLIDAAIEAGVQRFIPSEFGSDTQNEKSAELAIFKGKVAIKKYLEKKAAEGKITWTGLVNGPFLDWGMSLPPPPLLPVHCADRYSTGLKVGFLGFNTADKKATLYDGGSRPFSVTTLPDIGRAVVAILSHPEETKNRYVYVNSAVVTQREILAAYEKLTGAKWEIEEKDTAEVEKATNTKLAQGDFSTIHYLIYRGVFGEGYGGEFKNVSNELFGIEVLDGAGVEEVVKSTL